MIGSANQLTVPRVHDLKVERRHGRGHVRHLALEYALARKLHRPAVADLDRLDPTGEIRLDHPRGEPFNLVDHATRLQFRDGLFHTDCIPNIEQLSKITGGFAEELRFPSQREEGKHCGDLKKLTPGNRLYPRVPTNRTMIVLSLNSERVIGRSKKSCKYPKILR
jgi:hypothetical protein